VEGHTLCTVTVPIACSLEQSDAASRLGEWQELLRLVVGRSERVSPNRLELSLIPASDIVSAIGLAQREAACCPFFTFTLEIAAEHLVLVVEVPNDAVEILDQLVAEAR
jgi:hypothetical protein